MRCTLKAATKLGPTNGTGQAEAHQVIPVRDA